MFHELVTGQKYPLPTPDRNGSEEGRARDFPPNGSVGQSTIQEEDESNEHTNGNADHEKCGDAPSKTQIRLFKTQDYITHYYNITYNMSSLLNFLDYLKIDNVVINFLPLSWVNDLHRRSKFLNLFNIVFFSGR